MFLLISLLFFMTWASYIHFVISLFEPVTAEIYEEEPEKKPEIKYEDKYWDLFKRAANDFVVSNELVKLKCEELTDTISEELRKAEQDMEDFADMVTEEKRTAMQAKLDQLRQMDPTTEAMKFVVAQRLEQLATCVLIETTPAGNVIMVYNAKKQMFEYYNDCTIPYRYLDTACRKYVATFGCKPLYIDMNEQVKVSEAKTKLLRESKAKEKDIPKFEKKNVFAKFKTYNKDSGRGAPPKNSLPGGKKVEESEPVVIKEQTNKFLCLGKTRNFNTGKKIEQKVVNKKVSFADFKKMTKK